jgi:hypothetical protein
MTKAYQTSLALLSFDLVTPKPVPVVDLSTPELDQLVAALSVSARVLATSQLRPPGL